MKKRLLSFILCALMLLSAAMPAVAATPEENNAAIAAMTDGAAAWLENVGNKSFKGWDLFALSRCGKDASDLGLEYYNEIESLTFEEITAKSAPDIANVILCLASAGYDTTKIGGYNLNALLVSKLDALNYSTIDDYVKGYNTSSKVFSPLMVLHYLNLDLTGRHFTKEQYIWYCAKHLTDESKYGYTEQYPSVEIESMLMTALVPFRGTEVTYNGERIFIDDAILAGIAYYKNLEATTGGFPNGIIYGESVEGNSWILHGLKAAGANDAEFIKDGKTPLDGVRSFYDSASGGFISSWSGVNEYSTQQALYNLNGYTRALDVNAAALYDISDSVKNAYPKATADEKAALSDAVASAQGIIAQNAMTPLYAYSSIAALQAEVDKTTASGILADETQFQKNVLAFTADLIKAKDSLIEIVSADKTIIDPTENAQEIVPSGDIAVTYPGTQTQPINLNLGGIGAPMPEITVAKGDVSVSFASGTTVTSGSTHFEVLKTSDPLSAANINALTAVAGSGMETDQITAIYSFGGGNVVFSDFITITMPYTEGNVAYIGNDGTAHLIRMFVSAPTAEQIAAEGLNEYAYVSGTTLTVKTKHFTSFAVFKTKTAGGGAPPQKHVTVSVDYAGITNQSVVIGNTDTPLSVLYDAIGSGNVEQSGGYVSGIKCSGTWYREFSQGADSGWMYSVGGTFIQSGANNYILHDGDDVRWKFTRDLGNDIGGGYAAAALTALLEQKEYKESLDQVLAEIKKKSELSEWEIFALYSTGEKVGEEQVEQILDSIKEQNGNIRKPTDIARYALAIGMSGGDPTDAGGYNLIQKLYQNENLLLQGINGPVFALITLNSGYYSVPHDALWTKEKLRSYILQSQNADGGYSLEKEGMSDIDITAMALQALAVYKDREDTKDVIDKALAYLSESQQENGGFLSQGVNNTESTAQVIIALTALKIDPMSDPRFVKEEKTALSALTSFMLDDNTFTHGTGTKSDEMATEQAALALIASYRFFAGEDPLYEIRPYYYDDLGNASSWAQEPIVSATMNGIAKGTDGYFKPADSVSRAEFAAMLVRMLGIDSNKGGTSVFSDVPSSGWYQKEVQAAFENNLITGANGKFYPDKKINREEMAVMIARALALSGEEYQAGIDDLSAVSVWAKEGVKAAYLSGMMTGNGNAFRPADAVTREMAATVLSRAFELKK